MDEFFSRVALGFGVALTPENLLYCFIGVLVGTVLGVLPGIGPVTAIAVMLPLTFDLPPITAVILMCGMYYGAAYGGSTTAILINAPGESSSAVTCLDGFQMARQGRAKAALATAAIGSFFAGTFATLGLMLVSPLIADFAIRFGAAEYFALMVLALTMVSGLSTGSVAKGLMATLLGLFLGIVGVDYQTGAPRYIFGRIELYEGIDFIVVAIGLFAVSEVLISAGLFKQIKYQKQPVKGKHWISLEEIKQSLAPYVRGTVLGFLIGALPGAGGTTAAFLSYGVEKKVSKHPEQFGKGAIEGVAGPESSNNAAQQGAMVPLLTLGIPGSATTAVMLGAFMIYGVQPGPMLFEQQPEFVWGIFASMYIGNAILLILNLPLVNVFAKLLQLPGELLYSSVLAFCVLGVFALRLSTFDVSLLMIFGVVGYFMRKHGYPLAPTLLALVLGEMVEQSFRRALIFSNGDATIFITRPMSGVMLVLAVAVLVGPPLMSWVQTTREKRAAQTLVPKG